MSEIQFRFTAENMTTGEKADYIGQGESLEEASKDGLKNLAGTFRPNSNGRVSTGHGQPNTMGVTLPGGRIVFRTLREFEGREKYRDAIQL